MKTSTVNGVTYELPEGWEPIETVPLGKRIQVLYTNGESCPVTFDAIHNPHSPNKSNRIAWQHIVAPKVMPWKPKVGEEYWVIFGNGTPHCFVWTGSSEGSDYYTANNVYPTRGAAEAARPNVIAAHNGGAKWKGGV